MFKVAFGRGPVPVTLRNTRKAVEVGLTLDWLALFLSRAAGLEVLRAREGREGDDHTQRDRKNRCVGCLGQLERQARVFVKLARKHSRFMTREEMMKARAAK